MVHQGGCSWCCLHWCGSGLKQGTSGLRQTMINMWTLYIINSLVYQLFSFSIFPTAKTIAAIPRHKGTGLFQWPLAWQTSRGSPSKRKPSSQWKLQEELKWFGPWGWKQCWKPCPGSSKGLHAIAKKEKISFETWEAVATNILITAHLLHSVGPGNQDGTGRYSSQLSPHSLHEHCKNSANRRLHTSRGYTSLNRIHYFLKPQHFTGVTNGSLLLLTVLIVPLARAFLPLDVNLHAILTGYVIWLHWWPVLNFFGHLLASFLPDPHFILSLNSYPVIFGVVWQ